MRNLAIGLLVAEIGNTGADIKKHGRTRTQRCATVTFLMLLLKVLRWAVTSVRRAQHTWHGMASCSSVVKEASTCLQKPPDMLQSRMEISSLQAGAL
jgi:hypothetical protein